MSCLTFLGCTDTFAKLNDIMGELEGSYRLQNDVDAAYGKLCEIVKGEMLEKLNYKTIKISNGSSNKRRRVGKPWWNEDLSLLWNEVCLKESLWIKCKARYLKQIYKVDFLKKCKEFDRQVQRA